MKIIKMIVNYVKAAGIKFALAFSSLTLLMVLAQPATAHAAISTYAPTGSEIQTNDLMLTGLLVVCAAGIAFARNFSRR